MKLKDEKVRTIKELLNNIRIFKIYNWEEKIGENVEQARESEVKKMLSIFKIQTIMSYLGTSTRTYLMMTIIGV